jgi:exosortase/archaeosortase family protein
MKQALANPWVVLALTAGAFWDSWQWYLRRVWGTPEEALSLLLAVALVIGLWLRDRGGRVESTRLPLAALAAVLALYALGRPFAPDIVLAALAVTATIALLYRVLMGVPAPIAFYGLVALCLPVLPSLQFVAGFPMRIVSAAAAVGLLELQGLAVAREGTHLVWAGRAIEFDAPCSGVKMLWAGLLLTLSCCVAWRSGVAMTALAVIASLVLTVAANIIRAVSLFYVETGLVPGAAPWWHEAIGLEAFALAAFATLHLLSRLHAWEAAQWNR